MSDDALLRAQKLLRPVKRMDERTSAAVRVRYEFFAADNNAQAYRLATEAIARGLSHPIFDYVIGFCHNNGLSVPKDKKKAGICFKRAAEYKDARGEFSRSQYSDECRAILAEDYVFSRPEFDVIDARTAIFYCELLLRHEQYVDDALLYLVKLYGREQYGCKDRAKAIAYAERLAQSADPKMRAAARKSRLALLGEFPARELPVPVRESSC